MRFPAVKPRLLSSTGPMRSNIWHSWCRTRGRCTPGETMIPVNWASAAALTAHWEASDCRRNGRDRSGGGTERQLCRHLDGTALRFWLWSVWPAGQRNHHECDETGEDRHARRSVATAVAAGWDQALALTSTGAVYAWGLNRYGELGDGTTKNSDVPVLVDFPSGVTITQVAAGAYHSLAVSSTGTVYEWGLNSDGQLGIGTTIDQLTPTLVTFPPGALAHDVAGGDVDSLMVSTSGAVFAWGDNSYGGLGDGSTSPSPCRWPSSSQPIPWRRPLPRVEFAYGAAARRAVQLGVDFAGLGVRLGLERPRTTRRQQHGELVDAGRERGGEGCQHGADRRRSELTRTRGLRRRHLLLGHPTRGKDPQHVPVVSTLPTNETAVILSCGPDAEQSLTSLLSTG